MDHVKNLWSSYLQWVSEHPQLATDIETSIKWISYIATGNKTLILSFVEIAKPQFEFRSQISSRKAILKFLLKIFVKSIILQTCKRKPCFKPVIC